MNGDLKNWKRKLHLKCHYNRVVERRPSSVSIFACLLQQIDNKKTKTFTKKWTIIYEKSNQKPNES